MLREKTKGAGAFEIMMQEAAETHSRGPISPMVKSIFFTAVIIGGGISLIGAIPTIVEYMG